MSSTYISPTENTHVYAYIGNAILEVIKWCEKHKIPSDHGAVHAITVMNNASLALTDFGLERREELATLLAALLHDLDDRKYTPSKDYDGARLVLKNIGFTDFWGDDTTETIISMIGLVSCSKNGNGIDESLPKWYYIPRDADRLEALGYIGIRRAHDTTLEFAKRGSSQAIFWSDKTPRCSTVEELEKVATPDRIEEYKKTGFSESLIAHFYDKLLHIHHLSSGSTRLQGIADERRKILVDFVLEFGQCGTINWDKWLK